MIRIIAGRFRGKKLDVIDTDRDTAFRPTTDRMRERLFSMLAHPRYPAMDGARVLDLCAGSGALGLEALSRGASGAVFVEQDPKVSRLLARNIASCGLSGDPATLLRQEATNACGTPDMPFHFVFADPPYKSGLAEKLASLVFKNRCLTQEGVMIVETHKNDHLETPVGATIIDDRRQGIQRLRLFGYAAHYGA